MKNFKLIILLISISVCSCTTTKLLISNIKPYEVTDLQTIEPLSYISKIDKGNRGKLDDNASFNSKQLLIKVLENSKDQIPVTGELFPSDLNIKSTLEKEIGNCKPNSA